VENGAPALSARGLSKTFAGRRVLRDVELEVSAGEIHGLVGQNGSGKSTLVKILSGFHGPDPGGELRLYGEPVALPLAPEDADRRAMRFVHQDLGLFDEGTVLENLNVGRYDTGRLWRISWGSERRRARRALEDFGLELDLDAPVAALSEIERTMLVIARTLADVGQGPGILVLDEPTASLGRESTGLLFERLRVLAKRGFSIVFVSHRLDEVRSLTDRITVLRDGEVASRTSTVGMSEEDLISAILGVPFEAFFPEPHRTDHQEVGLRVQELAGGGVHGLTLSAGRGEVLGLTGLAGMGHEQVPYLLFGGEPATAGRIAVGGHELTASAITPRKAMAHGIALLPARRMGDGGAADATARENLTLATLPSYTSGPTLVHRRERRSALDLMRRFDVRPLEPERRFATFSGGNQQKLLLAKWFSAEPALMLLHEPTQGVDVGAKRQIFELIEKAAAGGTTILISSGEHDLLANLCDRVLVFRDGAVTAELHGASLTEDSIRTHSLRGTNER
jgi:ribose transport system ATP-binding protein